MNAKLSVEQRAAVNARIPGEPVIVEDDEKQKKYFLLAVEDLPQMWSRYVHAEVERGIADLHSDNVVPWDPGKMKQLARDSVSSAE